MSLDETKTVIGWIVERHGEQAASDWLWNCTPYPCGPASAEQVETGLRLAAGEVTLDALIGECVRQMDVEMREYAQRTGRT